MKVAILAGGLGSRLAEETEVKPKPMVEIGGKPILWHIMMYYSQFGFNDFSIALGYKGEVIKKYMVDYCALSSNLTVDMRNGTVTRNGGAAAPIGKWNWWTRVCGRRPGGGSSGLLRLSGTRRSC